jgi:hypothetical protein
MIGEWLRAIQLIKGGEDLIKWQIEIGAGLA